MLEVMIKLGDNVFQSREVSGAVCSGDFELESRASGVSFCGAWGVGFIERLIELLVVTEGPEGKDHNLRWSPDVAKRSVDCFCEEAGSQRIRVTGYE